jgi:hypothetical protein
MSFNRKNNFLEFEDFYNENNNNDEEDDDEYEESQNEHNLRIKLIFDIKNILVKHVSDNDFRHGVIPLCEFLSVKKILHFLDNLE